MGTDWGSHRDEVWGLTKPLLAIFHIHTCMLKTGLRILCTDKSRRICHGEYIYNDYCDLWLSNFFFSWRFSSHHTQYTADASLSTPDHRSQLRHELWTWKGNNNYSLIIIRFGLERTTRYDFCLYTWNHNSYGTLWRDSSRVRYTHSLLYMAIDNNIFHIKRAINIFANIKVNASEYCTWRDNASDNTIYVFIYLDIKHVTSLCAYKIVVIMNWSDDDGHLTGYCKLTTTSHISSSSTSIQIKKNKVASLRFIW